MVFKPRGHAENEHRHPHGQTLRVLRGRLVVRIGGMDHVLTPSSAPLDIEPGTDHATVAETPTWLVAESFAPTTKDS